MSVENFRIEAGQIMQFARALGDSNPAYYLDASSAESGIGVIAPPTFVQSSAHYDPTSKLRPRPGVAWLGSGRESAGAAWEVGGSLHAEQEFEYHRHPRAGDVLHSVDRAGQTWNRTGRRGGEMVFTELITEYYDQHDELVVVARKVSVTTQQAVG